MDLKDIFSPAPFEIAPFGLAICPQADTLLANWVQSGLTANNWANPDLFVRAFLSEHVCLLDASQPLGRVFVDTLTSEALQRISADFCAKCVWVFMPLLIEEASGEETVWRRRKTDEIYPFQKRDDETHTEHHQRILTDWAQDVSRRPVALERRINQAILSPMQAELEAVTKANRSIDFLIAGGWPKNLGIAQSAAMRAAIGLAKPSKLTEIMAQSAALKNTMMAGMTPDAIKRAGALFPQNSAVSAVMAYQKHLTALNFPISKLLKDVVDPASFLAAGLLPPDSRLADAPGESRRAMALIAGAGKWTNLAGWGLAQNPAQEAVAKFSTNLDFYRSLSRQFGLAIPTAYLASINASQVALSALAIGGTTFAASDLFKRGFQTIGALGMDGALPLGLSSDVLRHYSDMAANGASFSMALATAHLIDEDDLPPSSIGEVLSNTRALLLRLLDNEKDVIKRNGILYVLGFIVAVIALILSWQANQKNGPETKDFHELSRDVRALGREIQQHNQVHDEDRRQVEAFRYVHARSPLRSDPDTNASIVRYVYPDQIIRVIGQKDGWAKVEVFDYQSDQPILGWINRRNLRIVPLS